MCCYKNPKKTIRCCASSFSCRKGQIQGLILDLRKVALSHSTCRRSADLEDPPNFCQIDFTPSGMQMARQAAWSNYHFLLTRSKQHNVNCDGPL